MPIQSSNPFDVLYNNVSSSRGLTTAEDTYLKGMAEQPTHQGDPLVQSAKEFQNVNINNFEEWLKNNPSAEAKDYLIQWYMYKSSLQDARKYNESREDSYYQRMMEDMRKAGLSPYAFGGAGAPISQSDGFKVSGNNFSARARNQEDAYNTAMKNGIQAGTGIMSALAMIIMGLIAL